MQHQARGSQAHNLTPAAAPVLPCSRHPRQLCDLPQDPQHLPCLRGLQGGSAAPGGWSAGGGDSAAACGSSAGKVGGLALQAWEGLGSQHRCFALCTAGGGGLSCRHAARCKAYSIRLAGQRCCDILIHWAAQVLTSSLLYKA
jgi:hypothetical protein